MKELDALKEALSLTGLANAFLPNTVKLESGGVEPEACSSWQCQSNSGPGCVSKACYTLAGVDCVTLQCQTRAVST